MPHISADVLDPALAISSGSPFLDGAFCAGKGKALPVENPATEEIFAEIETCSLAQTQEAIDAARRSFDRGEWSGRTRDERAETVRAMTSYLEAHVPEIAATIQAETGATVEHIWRAQVGMPLQHARNITELYLSLPDEVPAPWPLSDAVASGRVSFSVLEYAPAGVVTSITAYNHPLYMSIWKVWPALLTGNSVILRPSPLTPMLSQFIARAAAEAGLPPGVLSVVPDGSAGGGELLTSHPDVDVVTFTGSTAVGRKIMSQAAATVKKVMLELGGKSVQLYLPDAVDRAGKGCQMVFGLNSGQACIAPTRMLVPQERKAEVVAAAAAHAATLKVGDPLDPTTVIGPLISAAQVQKCARYVDASVRAGGKVAFGGDVAGHMPRGHYFQPTVLDVPDNSNPAAQDEIFGPVLTVIGYEDIDHAVQIANDSVYGLASQVYSSDLSLAVATARRIRVGSAQVNGGTVHSYAPTGGFKQSGVGRERGVDGIRSFQELRHISVSPPGAGLFD